MQTNKIPEFISIIRMIRDDIYPSILEVKKLVDGSHTMLADSLSKAEKEYFQILAANLTMDSMVNEPYGVYAKKYVSRGDGTFDVTDTADFSIMHYLHLSHNSSGPQGVKGDAGPRGIDGPAGIQGTQGFIGPEGPMGHQGIQGHQGVIGSKGPMGSGLHLDGTVHAVADLPAGAKDGEAYFVELDGDLYVWHAHVSKWIDTGHVQGPKGDKGDRGVNGAQGQIGLVGQQGVAGPRGPQGNVGTDGPRGVKGDAGNVGQTGIQGITGQQGTGLTIGSTVALKTDLPTTAPDATAAFVTGDSSIYLYSSANKAWKSIGHIQGPQGVQGIKGETGNKGDTGLTGHNGQTGIQGTKGDTGAVGPKGDAGKNGAIGNVGHEGPKGKPGSSVHVKATVAKVTDLPLNANDGDVWYVTEDGDLHVWSTDSGVWHDLGHVQGPEGPRGIVGTQGPVGPQGGVGSTGAPGVGGTNGAAGPRGPSGPRGTDGTKGDTGVANITYNAATKTVTLHL